MQSLLDLDSAIQALLKLANSDLAVDGWHIDQIGYHVPPACSASLRPWFVSLSAPETFSHSGVAGNGSTLSLAISDALTTRKAIAYRSPASFPETSSAHAPIDLEALGLLKPKTQVVIKRKF